MCVKLGAGERRDGCPGGITLAAHAESRDAQPIGSRRLPSINAATFRLNTPSTQGHPEATDGAVGRSITQSFMKHGADKIALGVRFNKTPEWANTWASQQVGWMGRAAAVPSCLVQPGALHVCC